MKHDLLFHLVSRRRFKERQKSGYYYPAEDAENPVIVCYTADQVAEAANRHFKGRKTILMLVINSRRIAGKVTFTPVEGEEYPLIEKRLNLDAIIDKIRLEPDEEGLFDIRIEER